MANEHLVELMDVMGTDDSVVDAARVSFDKEASNYTQKDNDRLLGFLAKHDHWSPFSHVMLKFRITAPLFVARQLAKHQVGFSWNEISRRYVSFSPSFWTPRGWRKRAEHIKQGSSEAFLSNSSKLLENYDSYMKNSLDFYDMLLGEGVCAEQARAVLPQSINTQWIWSGSLYGFWRVYSLRTHDTAQNETKAIAKDIAVHCSEKFPLSWNALWRASQ